MGIERDFEECISCIPSGIIGIISIAVSPWSTNAAIFLCVAAWGVHCIHFYITQKDKLNFFTIFFFPLCFFFLIFSTFVVFCAALWYAWDFLKGIFATKSSTPTVKCGTCQAKISPKKISVSTNKIRRGSKNLWALIINAHELNRLPKTRILPPRNIGRILCPFCKTFLILPENSEGRCAQCQNCKNRFCIPDKFPHPLVQAKRSKRKNSK